MPPIISNPAMVDPAGQKPNTLNPGLVKGFGDLVKSSGKVCR